MKLSRIYCNYPARFEAIDFNPGLNVVVAEIRVPENLHKDTHNLGKTTLGVLLDFCLLSGRDNSIFLFKHFARFEHFVFFLELELNGGSYVTLRRSVEEPSKISFKKSGVHGQDFTDLPDDDWDHLNLPFDRAKTMLDGILELDALKPWSFRKGLGYLLRSQSDYTDVFRLARYASAHSDWKPYIAHILGFNSKLVGEYYSKEDELETLKNKEKIIRSELGSAVDKIGKIDGLLLLKHERAERQQEFLDSLDFRSTDKAATKELVDQLDGRIAELNQERYALTYSRKKVNDSIKDDVILFNPDDAEQLFNEAGVLFGGQLKRDFQQLLDFNKAITDERRQYLIEERDELDAELKRIGTELNALGKKRSASLSGLSETDVFKKYRKASDELVTLRADVIELSRQRTHLHMLQELRGQIRSTEESLSHLGAEVEDDVDKNNDLATDGMYKTIRLNFDAIVRAVIDRSALLTVETNQQHHLDFAAEILDEKGQATSADDGTSYKKLLCVAFDLAVLKAHFDKGYPRFVYHDGVFELLDPRKKSELLDVMREYADDGIQQIITLLDSDAPASGDDSATFSNDEIVLRLHDEGENGRLFKMDSW